LARRTLTYLDAALGTTITPRHGRTIGARLELVA